MEKFKFGLVVAGLFLFALSLQALIWGTVGWLIGLFFGKQILGWLAGIGIHTTMFKLFAILGVVKALLFGRK